MYGFIDDDHVIMQVVYFPIFIYHPHLHVHQVIAYIYLYHEEYVDKIAQHWQEIIYFIDWLYYE
jgi:hypothetical protein